MHYSKRAILFVAATAMRSSSKTTCSAFIPSSSSSSSRRAFHTIIQTRTSTTTTTSTTTGRSSFTASSTSIQLSNQSDPGDSSVPFTMNLNRSARDTKSSLSFTSTHLPSPTETILIARKQTITSSNSSSSTSNLPIPSSAPMEAMLKSIGKSGKTTTFLPDGSKFTLILLPDKVTRNNHYMSPHTITDSLNVGGSLLKGGKDGCQIIVVDQDIKESVTAVAVAIARAMPVYTSKSLSNKQQQQQQQDANCADEAAAGGGYLHLVNVSYYTELNEGKVVQDEDLNSAAKAVADGVRLAGRLGDMPPAELDPETYSKECMEIVEGLIAKGHQVEMEEIVGEELRDQGYGGIYGVGMAAIVPPRMVILTYTPEGGGDDDLENVALCGKGVVYDTGGLSLKGKAGMCGMKHDMGGSAGVLGGFKAAVELKVPKKITLILAIVENAIGPKAFRNDDILTMYSGKTVEINNTDAEGRLVLADCVAHASKNIKGVDIIMDMATLTGAQLVTTGKKHAGILAQSEELEKRMFECGLKSGDLCYPMLYAPELLKSEFASKVADMKNSVKDRGNAQASCAGHFIESHLDPSYEGDWVHVDMAGPDSKNERATGYGVALVLGLLQVPSFC